MFFFIPVKNTKTSTTISALTTHIFSIFGPPKYLVSDNVSYFRSQALKDYCLEWRITHIFTTPYYPKPSHAERANKEIKGALRIFHNQHQQHWDQHLSWFQVAFNSAIHSSTKTTPAQLFLGRPIQHPLELHWDLANLLNQRIPPPSLEQEWSRALNNLREARAARELRYNANREPTPFKVGDWVMYRLNPISRAVDHINHKLLPMWSKPCVIQVFTSPVTVQLVNPSTGRPVRKAHVSQLKRFFQPEFK